MYEMQIYIKKTIMDFIVNFTIALTFDRCDLWQLQQFCGWDNWDLNFLFVWNLTDATSDTCEKGHMT